MESASCPLLCPQHPASACQVRAPIRLLGCSEQREWQFDKRQAVHFLVTQLLVFGQFGVPPSLQLCISAAQLWAVQQVQGHPAGGLSYFQRADALTTLPHSSACRVAFLGSYYPWSTAVWKYKTENFRSKQFIRFK